MPRRVSDAVMVAGPFKARRLVATELSRRVSDAEIRWAPVHGVANATPLGVWTPDTGLERPGYHRGVANATQTFVSDFEF